MFEHRLNDRPKARRARLAVQCVGDELVVYDSLTHQAHCLSPDAVAVWELADGVRTCAEIGDELGRDAGLVRQAVDELRQVSLMEDPSSNGLSRREAAKRLAKVGGAAFAAPLIYSVAVPMAAAAASCASQGSTVTCGIAAGDCNAAAGQFGTVVGTTCSCYQGASNTTCYYTTNATGSCVPSGGNCAGAKTCCAPGSCGSVSKNVCGQ
jgi:hypothetical protein